MTVGSVCGGLIRAVGGRLFQVITSFHNFRYLIQKPAGPCVGCWWRARKRVSRAWFVDTASQDHEQRPCGGAYFTLPNRSNT